MAFVDDSDELNGGGFGRVTGGIDTAGVGDFSLGDGLAPYPSGAFGVGVGEQPTLYWDMSNPITTVSVLDAAGNGFSVEPCSANLCLN